MNKIYQRLAGLGGQSAPEKLWSIDYTATNGQRYQLVVHGKSAKAIKAYMLPGCKFHSIKRYYEHTETKTPQNQKAD